MRSLLSLRLTCSSVFTAAAVVSTAYAAIPVNVSVTPASGTGSGPPNFTYTFSDGDGATNLRAKP